MDGNMENVKDEKEIWGRRGEETKGRVCVLRAGDGGRSLLSKGLGHTSHKHSVIVNRLPLRSWKKTKYLTVTVSALPQILN